MGGHQKVHKIINSEMERASISETTELTEICI